MEWSFAFTGQEAASHLANKVALHDGITVQLAVPNDCKQLHVDHFWKWKHAKLLSVSIAVPNVRCHKLCFPLNTF